MAQQRSFKAEPDGWALIPAFLGQSTLREPRFSKLVFYRLVALSEVSFKLQLDSLRSRITNSDQLRRAIDPSFVAAEGEVLPDNGDGVLPKDAEGKALPLAWATQPGMVRVYQSSQYCHRRSICCRGRRVARSL